MKLSRRLADVAPSPSLAVSMEIGRLRAAGRDVINFGVGEPDFPAVRVAREAAHASLDAGESRYTPTPGIPRLREAIASAHATAHGSEAVAEEVVVGCGAKAVLFELLQALVDPGDEVVVSSPYWVSFPAQVRLAGGSLVAAPTDAGEGFVPRASQVRDAMTGRTRAVIVNSPCNPSGAIMPPDEVEALVRLCAEREVFLIFDEVYDRFIFEGQHCSPLRWRSVHPDGIACVGAASKTFAMPGWRIGYGIVPGLVGAALAKLQGHVTSGASSIAQAGAAEAFREGWTEVAAMIEEFRIRRDLTVEALSAVAGVRCPRPSGAFFVFPAIELEPGRPVESTALALHLLQEEGVGVVPGTAFGCEGHLRISFAVDRDELQEGLARIARAVERLRRDPGRLGA